MFSNARTYNEFGSAIYVAADMLEVWFRLAIWRLTGDPLMQQYPDEGIAAVSITRDLRPQLIKVHDKVSARTLACASAFECLACSLGTSLGALPYLLAHARTHPTTTTAHATTATTTHIHIHAHALSGALAFLHTLSQVGLRPRDAKPFGVALEDLDVGDDYFETIALPIDLGTVGERLMRGVYKKVGEYLWDLNRVWVNARAYVKHGHACERWRWH